jgi:hypothetical protein
MKKIAVLMLVTGITLTTIAQPASITAKTTGIFDLPASSIRRSFTVELGKGNKMQVELPDIDDLDRLNSIDSLVRVFLQDIKSFKDSLSDELSSKRIDYLVDSAGKNKIRIQNFQPKGSSFLVNNGDIAALKLDQDTINILIPVLYDAGYYRQKTLKLTRYCRVGFYLNQAADINNYANGFLKEKIEALRKSDHLHWVRSDSEHWTIANGDNTIFASQPAGYVLGSTSGDFLELHAGANIQNYKNYFDPSVSIGAKAVISNKFFKYEIGMAWEKHFLFAKDLQGNLQTFRSNFLTLELGRKSLRPNEKGDGPYFNFADHLSLSYLLSQQGTIFDRHTFRLATGGVGWKNDRIKLEPLIYFHDFFKAATPGLRLSLNF